MRVAIAGAGKVGRSIARELIGFGHEILLIDRDADGDPIVRILERPVRGDGPRVKVIGEHRRRADENPVGKARRFIDQGVILQFAVIAHDDCRADIGAAANIAVAAHRGALPDLRQMPHPGPVPDVCGVCHI